MTQERKRTRINFHATEKISNYVKDYAEELGMSQGAFISMCIAKYAEQDNMLTSMTTIQATMEQLTQLQSLVKKSGE